LSDAIDFVQNGVATHLCGGNHAIDAFDVVETDGQGLRHDCIHGQARRREKLIDPLDGVLVARGPSFGEFLLLQEAVDKRLQNAPAPYTLWRS